MRQIALIAAAVLIAAPLAAWALTRGSAAAQDAGGQLRRYFIQAEQSVWDYAPDRRNRVTGGRFDEEAGVFVRRERDRIGSRYRKALFRGYTDATFKTRLDQGSGGSTSGCSGP
jgi:hephaestin